MKLGCQPSFVYRRGRLDSMRRKIEILEQIYYLLSTSLIMAYQKAQSTPFTNALINALMMEDLETLKRTAVAVVFKLGNAEMLQWNWAS